MAVDKKISQLTSLAQVDVSASTDVLPIVDTSATETKKITVSALVGAGATAGISGAVLTNGTINSTTIGATTPSTGSFTTLTTSSTVTLNGGTANGVLYLNGSKVATSGSALVFDGTNVGIGTASPTRKLTISGSGVFAATTGSSIRLDNSSTGRFAIVDLDNSQNLNIWNSDSGAGSIVFWRGSGAGTETARFDASGNLGLGVTPSAWSGVGAALQVGVSAAIIGNSASSSSFISNAYFDGTNYRYIGTGFAQRLALTSGAYAFQTAASGTAGNAITFTQAMTLDASGNLLVGTTSSGQGRLMVKQASSSVASGIAVQATSNDSYLGLWNDGSVFNIEAYYNSTGSYQPIAFRTSNTERMRIDSSGNVAVGFTGNAGQGIFQVARTISGGGPATSGTTDANQVMVFNASSVQLGYGAYANGTGWIQQRATASYATNYDLVLQPNGGNVGIGTASPTDKFQIEGTATAPVASIRSTTTGSVNQAALNLFRGDSTNGFAQFGVGTTSTNTWQFGLRSGSTSWQLFDVSANTARVVVDTSGNVLVGITSATSGGGVLQISNGITFPATQSASSNANTLDDYEEGTWTPTFTFSTSSTGVTYSTQVGSYIKIGRYVWCWFDITLSAIGSASGTARVSGLPFAITNNANARGSVSVSYFDGFSGVNGLVVRGEAGQTYGTLAQNPANGAAVTDLSNTNFTNTTRLNGVFTFSASA